MALNPNYDAIGKAFIQQYYAIFDDPIHRPNIINMYNEVTSFLSFEGTQFQGAAKILEKLNTMTVGSIKRVVTSVDSQPMFDGGVIISVLGKLQIDNNFPRDFTQVFVLKPMGTSFYCAHDIFRLGLSQQ